MFFSCFAAPTEVYLIFKHMNKTGSGYLDVNEFYGKPKQIFQPNIDFNAHCPTYATQTKDKLEDMDVALSNFV